MADKTLNLCCYIGSTWSTLFLRTAHPERLAINWETMANGSGPDPSINQTTDNSGPTIIGNVTIHPLASVHPSAVVRFFLLFWLELSLNLENLSSNPRLADFLSPLPPIHIFLNEHENLTSGEGKEITRVFPKKNKGKIRYFLYYI